MVACAVIYLKSNFNTVQSGQTFKEKKKKIKYLGEKAKSVFHRAGCGSL